MHGKNICDVALSNLPSNAITEAIRSGDFIFSGSPRNRLGRTCPGRCRRADRREQSLEGLYWLAVLKGKAYTLAEDTVVNTDTIPAGYLVVKAQWLRLEQRECEGKLRSYTLLEAETLIIVNHMVRLAGLRFSPGPGGPADRQLRSAREKLYYIGLQTHYSLEACCSEDQSY